MNTENINQWNLTFIGLESTWLRALALVLALAAVYFSWTSIQTLHPAVKRWLVLFLRCIAVAIIFLMLLQPQMEQKEVLKLKNKVVCILDNSMSMTLKGGDTGIARSQLVDSFFKENASFVRKLQDDFDVDFVTFSDAVKEISDADVRKGLVYDGVNTDVVRMLQYLKKRYDGKSVKGCFVFSDGADTGEYSQGVDKLEIASNLAAGLSAPFFTFAPGGNMDVKDVAISDIVYDAFTFVRSPWRADVVIKIFGYKGLRIPVTLKQGNDVIASKIIDVGNEKEVHIDLSFTPYNTGTFLYTVSLPVQPQEAITENNQVRFLVKVVRDKIRIMHVCGRPSWDERFLRRILKNDPNIDLISFFILRSPTDNSEARNDELSLIPFPIDELFTHALSSFDLVIFQNFDYRPYDAAFFRFSHYLNNVRKFVTDQGGGFVMIGGDISFSQGGYDGTALEDILPVELNGAKDTIDLSRLKATLTNDGMKHPITFLEGDADRNAALWNELPALDGCNKVARLKADAVPLTTFPISGTPPLISVRDAGQGRCMAITTDSLWRWNFITVGQGGSNRHYLKFWQNSIKWLIKDASLNPVHIRVNKETFLPNEEVQARVEALGRNYQPLEGVLLDMEVTDEFSGEHILYAKGATDADGQYRLAIKHNKEGYYVVKVTAKKENEEIGQDYAVFSIAAENKEFKDPAIRRDLLARLSGATGGRYFDLPVKDVEEKISLENPAVTKLVGNRRVTLWDNGYIFFLLLATASAEWWIRKRSGLS